MSKIAIFQPPENGGYIQFWAYLLISSGAGSGISVDLLPSFWTDYNQVFESFFNHLYPLNSSKNLNLHNDTDLDKKKLHFDLSALPFPLSLLLID